MIQQWSKEDIRVFFDWFMANNDLFIAKFVDRFGSLGDGKVLLSGLDELMASTADLWAVPNPSINHSLALLADAHRAKGIRVSDEWIRDTFLGSTIPLRTPSDQAVSIGTDAAIYIASCLQSHSSILKWKSVLSPRSHVSYGLPGLFGFGHNRQPQNNWKKISFSPFLIGSVISHKWLDGETICSSRTLDSWISKI